MINTNVFFNVTDFQVQWNENAAQVLRTSDRYRLYICPALQHGLHVPLSLCSYDVLHHPPVRDDVVGCWRMLEDVGGCWVMLDDVG